MAKKKQSIAEASRESGVPYGTLHGRLQMGWSLKKAMSTPVRKKSKSKPEPKPKRQQENIILSTPEGPVTLTRAAYNKMTPEQVNAMIAVDSQPLGFLARNTTTLTLVCIAALVLAVSFYVQ